MAYCVDFPADANNGTTRHILNLSTDLGIYLQRATRISDLDLTLFEFTAA